MKKFEQNEIYNKKHKNEHTTFIYLFKQPYFSQNFEGNMCKYKHHKFTRDIGVL